MTDFYKSNPQFFVGVDCVIFGLNKGELSILLAKRNFEPEKGKWSLMGGFVQEGESVDDAAKRVLLELTGLNDVYMEQVGAFGAVDRDPGERVISVAYYALINFDEYDRIRVMEHNAQWISIHEMPQLGFELQSLYETILGENIDKRNFRKRIAENCCIEKTDQIDKTSSRRGASLYKFNDRAYRRDPKFKI